MMCCCEKCRFVFESIRLLEHCPDCGHGPVREATDDEIAEYASNRLEYGPMPVYGISNLHLAHEVDMPMLVSANNGYVVLKPCRTMAPAILM